MGLCWLAAGIQPNARPTAYMWWTVGDLKSWTNSGQENAYPGLLSEITSRQWCWGRWKPLWGTPCHVRFAQDWWWDSALLTSSSRSATSLPLIHGNTPRACLWQESKSRGVASDFQCLVLVSLATIWYFNVINFPYAFILVRSCISCIFFFSSIFCYFVFSLQSYYRAQHS